LCEPHGPEPARENPQSPRPHPCDYHPLTCGPSLPPDAAREYRLRAIFECGKLDPQVGDCPVLAPFPLLLSRAEWRRVGAAAESLWREALAAECELLRRPDLHPRLALPGPVTRALRRCAGRGPAPAGGHPRVARFDFHWAADVEGGAPRWQVSEVNSDVPGGFIEAGVLARAMAGLCGAGDRGLASPPDPAEALAGALTRALASRAAVSGPVALVHATAFADDFQVMRRLGAALEARGIDVVLAAPDQVSWARGALPLERSTGRPLGAVVRFYPGEWLAELSSPAGLVAGWFRAPRWLGYFAASVPLANPATALLLQSKRWPLVWDRLSTPLPTWRAMLPETRDPREMSGDPTEGWVLKPAMGRVGEGVLIPGLGGPDAGAIRKAARHRPRHWVSQRRFHSVPVDSPAGPLHTCLGVYVIDGAAAGVYARASRRPLIDQGAFEIPVLLEEDR
jgi:glutathionylspermidine synthase